VTEVQVNGADTLLVLSSGRTVGLASVTALREAAV
jgi:hypothetical protein